MLALFEEGAHALLLVGGLEAGAEGLLLDHHASSIGRSSPSLMAFFAARTAMGAFAAIWEASFSAAA